MDQDKRNDRFVIFPYPRENYDDGSVNYGGIDLLRETERIDEIEEAKRSPNLRRLLEEVNLQDGLFMTLGCDYRQLEGGISGYVDFAFRPGLPVSLTEDASVLDDYFWAYLAKQEIVHHISDGAMVNYARSALEWSWSPLEIAGTSSKKVTLAFCCQRVEDGEWCLDHLRHFLVTEFPDLPARQR
ncbi:hypothetical protein ACFSFZ_13715 [Mixta tenebrionis]|uniref:Uncharacterized protein n=1 Tax=Mixta tenebrionis TaxID=2562439 RepID=A0A506VEV5_9GAMM|nr:MULTISPECIES: hypothetical protein [Mixta]QHM75812.1 hypothetical protein C7M52_01769 [Mixta theicola]TPW44347.1 hypothetical protein FKM52_01135 [Mixta tenebrionis]